MRKSRKHGCSKRAGKRHQAERACAFSLFLPRSLSLSPRRHCNSSTKTCSPGSPFCWPVPHCPRSHPRFHFNASQTSLFTTVSLRSSLPLPLTSSPPHRLQVSSSCKLYVIRYRSHVHMYIYIYTLASNFCSTARLKNPRLFIRRTAFRAQLSPKFKQFYERDGDEARKSTCETIKTITHFFLILQH